MKALFLILLAFPVQAQSLPDAGFFVGDYELTGHAPGPGNAPLSDWVSISGDSFPLTLKSCRLGAGTLELADVDREGADPLRGTLGDLKLWCRFLSDGDNYPRLTCYAEPDGDHGPGLITLWPAHWSKPDNLKDCP